jgi:hypothetical protein
MSTELVNKETGEIMDANQAAMGMLDDLPSADASDYRIPNLCIVQPTSKLQNAAGEIVDLNTKHAVGAAGKALNFVPLWFFKTWEIYHVDKQNNREYIGKELFGPKNAMWKWEEEAKDFTIKRHLNTNVFMILEKDLDSPMPQLYMFKFRGKSSVEGKKLLTFWTNAKNYKQIPFSYVFSITPQLITDQKGKYYVASVANVMDGDKYRMIKGPQLAVATGWVDMIKTNLAAMTSAQLAVTDEDVEETPDSGPIQAGPVVQDAQNQLTF